MEVRLLDAERYEVLDEAGIQVQQGAILSDWRIEASRRHRHVVEVIAEELKLPPRAAQRTAEVRELKVGELPAHEHPQYLAAMPEHEHPLLVHDHAHTHAEFDEIRGDQQTHGLTMAQGFRVIETKLVDHKHPEKADVDHWHPNTFSAEINVLRLAVEALQDAPLAPHAHEGMDAKIATLRTQIGDLADRTTLKLAELQTQIVDGLAAIREDMKQPHVHEYVSLDLYNEHLTAVGRRRNLQELSRQEVNGKLRLVIEEVE